LDAVLAALELLPHAELDRGERIRQAPEERLQPLEQLLQPERPVHGERDAVPSAQRKRLQHSRKAEEVIRVEMREEDLLELGQPDARALQLPLRPLRAVEEQPLAAVPYEQRGRRPERRRHRGRGTEKDEVEIHAAIVGSRAWPIRPSSTCTAAS